MESKQVRYTRGALASIQAVTFGQPGQRTFDARRPPPQVGNASFNSAT